MQSFRWSEGASRSFDCTCSRWRGVAVVEATLLPSTNKFERSSVAPECNRMPASVERRSTQKAICHDGAMASGLSKSRRRCRELAYLRPVIACCRIRDSQGSRGPKVSAALEEGEKSEICVIQARYYGVVSARVTCYSIGSEACALLPGLSQPVIGVDRSSDSEVFRVTRGIG